MLQFFSASARIINTRNAVDECLEIALGNSYDDVKLIILHAAVGHNFNEMVDQVHKKIPNAQIVAASCCGVVGKEGVSESMKDMAMMAVKGDDFAVSSTNNIYGNNTFDKTLEMAKELKEKNPNINMIYTLASGIDIDNNATIRAIETVFGENITIFGATSSDNMKGVISYQAVNQEVFTNGAFLVGFADPSLKIATKATHGFVAIGSPLLVTKSNGHIIEELNGNPAWNEYTKRLGLTEDTTCGDSIPIGALGEALPENLALEYGNSHILRVVTKHNKNEMYYATDCPVGTNLWLTVRDEDLIFAETEKMVAKMKTEIDNAEIAAVFHADCLARGRFLFNRVMKEELVSKMQNPFYKTGECPPWLGMYGFGEFAKLGGKNTYHNYTTALYILYRV